MGVQVVILEEEEELTFCISSVHIPNSKEQEEEWIENMIGISCLYGCSQCSS